MSENKKVAQDLSFFMPSKAKQVEEEKAIVSTRFVDEEGKVVPFVFKPITTERIDQIEALNTRKTRFKGQMQERVDYGRFMAQIAVETTVYPNFQSEELRKAYKTEDPIEVAKNVLHVGGEYTNWISKSSEINGFDDTIEDLEDMAKN